MNTKQLIDGYEEWLTRFNWAWFGTLTFRDYPTLNRANSLFKKWISEIEKEDGTSDFRWFRVTERGAFNDNIHFHVLVGGLRKGSKWPWIFRWEELAGGSSIAYYFRSGGAARYVVKTAQPGRDFEIDFHLPLNTSRPK